MDISVNVTAPAGFGKTTVTAIIANTLRDLGFTVEIEEDVDFASEADLLAMSTDERVEAVAGVRTIKLTQTQMTRRQMMDNTADVEYFQGKVSRATDHLSVVSARRQVCADQLQAADAQIEVAIRQQREAQGRLELIQKADRTYGLEGI